MSKEKEKRERGRPTKYGAQIQPIRVTPEMQEFVKDNGGAKFVRELIESAMRDKENTQQ